MGLHRPAAVAACAVGSTGSTRLAIVVLAASCADVHRLTRTAAVVGIVIASVGAASATLGLPSVADCRAWVVIRQRTRFGNQIVQAVGHGAPPAGSVVCAARSHHEKSLASHLR